MTIEQKLSRLHNRATTYEVIMEQPAIGVRYLVRYTSVHSIRGMRSVVAEGAAHIVAIAGCDTFTGQEGKGVATRLLLGEWVIRFSGRTQREAIVEGEYPFINTLPEVVAF